MVFGARVVSIFTGMLFLIMITGWLDPSGFGLWEVILTLVAVCSYAAGFLGYWATRDIARGRLLGRTVVVLNLAISVLSVAAYLVFTALTYPRFEASNLGYLKYGPFLFSALLIPLAYWNQAALSTANGYRPTAFGWSLMVSEPGKLVVGYLALFVFRMGIYGVIMAVMTSYLLQAFVMTLLVAGAVVQKTDFAAARSWARYSWVPGIIFLAPALASLDTVLASAISSTNLAGHYQAAFQVGTIVSYVAYLSYALYPLLLRGESDVVPNVTLDLILMFGIPMSAGVIALAPQLLTVLNLAYVASGADVAVPLGLLGMAGLVTAISQFLDNVLTGREKSDLQLGKGPLSYLKTSFAFVSWVNLCYAVSYIALVSLTIYYGGVAGSSITQIVTVWALLQLVLLSSAAAVKFRRVLRTVRIGVPPSLPKYLLSSLLMVAAVTLLAGPLLPYTADRLVYAVRALVVIMVGGAAYFGVLAAIDRHVRALVRSLLAF